MPFEYQDWYGTNADPSRPAIRLQCDPDVPCYDITLDNVNMWTDNGSYVYWLCENAYGSGACLQEADSTADLSTYTSTVSITATPYITLQLPPFFSSGVFANFCGRTWTLPTMADDLTTAPPTTTSFTIPPMPTSFYPSVSQISTLLDLDSAGGL